MIKRLAILLFAITLSSCLNPAIEEPKPIPEEGVVWISEEPPGWFRAVAKEGGHYYVGMISIEDKLYNVYGGFSPGAFLSFKEMIFDDGRYEAEIPPAVLWSAYCDLYDDRVVTESTVKGDERFVFVKACPEDMSEYDIDEMVNALENGYFAKKSNDVWRTETVEKILDEKTPLIASVFIENKELFESIALNLPKGAVANNYTTGLRLLINSLDKESLADDVFYETYPELYNLLHDYLALDLKPNTVLVESTDAFVDFPIYVHYFGNGSISVNIIYCNHEETSLNEHFQSIDELCENWYLSTSAGDAMD